MLTSLKDLINKNQQIIKCTDIALFNSAIDELDKIIGMQSIKQSIADQIKTVIVSKQQGFFRQNMLHCMICGPPGVGKTKVAKILSQLWFSLGFVRGYDQKTLPNYEDSYKKTKEILLRANETIRQNSSQFKRLRDKFCKRQYYNYHEFQDIVSEYNALVGTNLQSYLTNLLQVTQAENIKQKKKSTEYFKIVSREDLISKYLGGTANKTREVLESCIGGVLFIDEAYSICTNDRDSYGRECLTTINQFMTEHNDEIIIIMAGYNPDSLFEQQPGLRRRLTLHTIEPYTSDELCRIFEQQLGAGWYFDRGYAESFFRKNLSSFANYGGDTEKLALQIKMIYCRHIFDTNQLYTKERHLTESMFEQSLLHIAEKKPKPPVLSYFI